MHDVWAFEQMKTDAEWSSEWYQILEHDGIVIEFTPGLVSVVPMFDVGLKIWWRPPAARKRKKPGAAPDSAELPDGELEEADKDRTDDENGSEPDADKPDAEEEAYGGAHDDLQADSDSSGEREAPILKP